MYAELHIHVTNEKELKRLGELMAQLDADGVPVTAEAVAASEPVEDKPAPRKRTTKKRTTKKKETDEKGTDNKKANEQTPAEKATETVKEQKDKDKDSDTKAEPKDVPVEGGVTAQMVKDKAGEVIRAKKGKQVTAIIKESGAASISAIPKELLADVYAKLQEELDG